LSVTNEITTAGRIDRNFIEITENYFWDENNESLGNFTVGANGWKTGKTEDG
jgi:hypothetical protein